MATYTTTSHERPTAAGYARGDVINVIDPAAPIASWIHLGSGVWERNDTVQVRTSPGGGNRLLAGNLPADMAQLANVVVSDGALQSWTANGIDYVATYSDGKVATVTASDGWVQTYTWVGDVPTITVKQA